jgi:predicted nucleic acid-binding protein
MKFILDTTAYSEFNRGDLRLKKWFSAEHEIIIPLIVVGELRAGFAAGSKQAENKQLLQRFLDSPNVITITLSNKTTQHFADIYLQLRQSATPIGTNDMWIAALALEENVPVLTLDSDFSYIEGLELVKL